MLFNDPASLDPETVLDWLNLCHASLDLEEQTTYELLLADRDPPQALIDSLEIGASKEDISQYFASCRQEMELAAVLTLVASAEARIRLDTASRIKKSGDALAKRLSLLKARAPTEWAIPLYEGGIIEAWKTYIRTLTTPVRLDQERLLSAIGRFKNLLDIRHWVAHGRYWEPRWGTEQFPADGAAKIVSEMYAAFRQVANHGDLLAFR
jgi:hypothetical protein